MKTTIAESDTTNVRKYVQLIEDYLTDRIHVAQFESDFLQIRRDDSYWMSGSFSDTIGRVLNTIFLDVDEYTPDELYNPNDEFTINEQELRSRLQKNLLKLQTIIQQTSMGVCE